VPAKVPGPAKVAAQPKAADGSASAAKPAKAAAGQQQRQQGASSPSEISMSNPLRNPRKNPPRDLWQLKSDLP
jgi:hypothetical protein